jgi:hypothetical protein
MEDILLQEQSLPQIRFGGIFRQPTTCQLNKLSTCIHVIKNTRR